LLRAEMEEVREAQRREEQRKQEEESHGEALRQEELQREMEEAEQRRQREMEEERRQEELRELALLEEEMRLDELRQEEARLQQLQQLRLEQRRQEEAKLEELEEQLRAEELPPSQPEQDGNQPSQLEQDGNQPSQPEQDGFRWASLVPLQDDSECDEDPDTQQVETPHESLAFRRPAPRAEHEEIRLDQETDLPCRTPQGTELFALDIGDDESCADGVGDADELGHWDVPDEEEPLDFYLLGVMGDLPEAHDVAEKLQNNQLMHEELVRKLCKRNELLRASVREIGRSPNACAASKARAETPQRQHVRSTSPKSQSSSASQNWSTSSMSRALEKLLPAAQEARRQRLLREEMAAKMIATQAERARQREEQQEATLRSRLDRTMKSSRDRIHAMKRREDHENEQIRLRSEIAWQTKEGMDRSIKAALRECSNCKAQSTALEAQIEAINARGKARDKDADRQYMQGLRNELKAHRAREARSQQRERRCLDLKKEIQREIEAFSRASSLPFTHMASCR